MCPRRLRQDINGVLQSQEILQSIGVTASLAPDDGPDGRRHLVATIEGPPDTIYEGEVYVLDVLLSQGYPFDPPEVIFATEIWHPHVCQETGQVNLVRALFVVYRILSASQTRPLTLLIDADFLCNYPVQRSGPPQVLF
jgi:ubiquitin-protein ligase